MLYGWSGINFSATGEERVFLTTTCNIQKYVIRNVAQSISTTFYELFAALLHVGITGASRNLDQSIIFWFFQLFFCVFLFSAPKLFFLQRFSIFVQHSFPTFSLSQYRFHTFFNMCSTYSLAERFVLQRALLLIFLLYCLPRQLVPVQYF